MFTDMYNISLLIVTQTFSYGFINKYFHKNEIEDQCYKNNQ